MRYCHINNAHFGDSRSRPTTLERAQQWPCPFNIIENFSHMSSRFVTKLFKIFVKPLKRWSYPGVGGVGKDR